MRLFGIHIGLPSFPGNPFHPPSPSDLLPPGLPTAPSPQLPTPSQPFPTPPLPLPLPLLPSPGNMPGFPGNGNSGPKPEDRLAEFKFADGSPMWKTETQKAALLKILQQDPTMTVEAFTRSQEMARICTATYPLQNGSQVDAEGYSRIDAVALGLDPKLLGDPSTGLHAEVYRNNETGKYVLSFRGTDKSGDALIKDIKNGDLQAFDPRAPQFKQAIDLAKLLKDKLGDKLTDITGQSLGGGLATAASVFTGIRATTFNAAGLNPATVAYHGGSWDERRMQSLITNYRVAGEPLTEAQEGTTLTAMATALFGHLTPDWLRPPGLPLAPIGHQPQVSYISGALAEQLPDAVGRQITIAAIDQNGNAMGRSDQIKPGNWQYLHNFDAIEAGMLARLQTPTPQGRPRDATIA